MTHHPLAASLNATLSLLAPPVTRMLSARGAAAFFPTGGILGQAAEARGKAIDATIGIALDEDGRPLGLASITDGLGLPVEEVLPYAPSYGLPALRDRWALMIREKSPGLAGAPISRPVVTCALTHALSTAGQLFLDPGDTLFCSDLYWGNYRLIFEAAFGARIARVPTFAGPPGAERGLDVEGMVAALLAGPPGKRVVLLNFPNNPTGYTPTEEEVGSLVSGLTAVAEAGHDLVVLIDDAYFGLVYEPGVWRESVFAPLATAHERLLAVKIDGPTKEDYVWGLRVGFLTFAGAGLDADGLAALEHKAAGLIRGNISNAPRLSQSLLLRAFDAPAYREEKAQAFAVLERRYAATRATLDANPGYRERFVALPFNSGYFMCVRPLRASAEAVRRHLLAEHDTGLIATDGLLRVAFSSAPLSVIAQLFENLDRACQAVEAAGERS